MKESIKLLYQCECINECGEIVSKTKCPTSWDIEFDLANKIIINEEEVLICPTCGAKGYVLNKVIYNNDIAYNVINGDKI